MNKLMINNRDYQNTTNIIEFAIKKRAELLYNSLDESILTISEEEALERIELEIIYMITNN